MMYNIITNLIIILLIELIPINIYKKKKEKEIYDLKVLYEFEKNYRVYLEKQFEKDAKVITRLRKLTASTSSSEFYDLLKERGIIE